jgi:hypothetical protein
MDEHIRRYWKSKEKVRKQIEKDPEDEEWSRKVESIPKEELKRRLDLAKKQRLERDDVPWDILQDDIQRQRESCFLLTKFEPKKELMDRLLHYDKLFQQLYDAKALSEIKPIKKELDTIEEYDLAETTRSCLERVYYFKFIHLFKRNLQ